MTAWYKCSGITVNSAVLCIQQWSKDGTWLANVNVSPYISGTKDWAQVFLSYTVPAAVNGTPVHRITFVASGYKCNGAFWVDDVRIWQIKDVMVTAKTASEIEPNKAVTGNATLANNTGYAKPVTFIMGIYKDDQLVDLKTVSYELPPYDVITLSLQSGILPSDTSGYSVSMFLWQDLDNIKPL